MNGGLLHIVMRCLLMLVAQAGGTPPATQSATLGEGLEQSIEPTWMWSPTVLLLFAVAAIVFVVVLYLQERGPAGKVTRVLMSLPRLLLMALVLVMLFGWMVHRNRTDLPDVVVLIDDSESMLFDDHYADDSLRAKLAQRVASIGGVKVDRLTLAKALLLENDQAFLRSLSQRYNLKIYRIGDSARGESDAEGTYGEFIKSLEASQTSSRLGKCLRDVLELQRGRPTAGIVLLTDGITTDGKKIGEVADYARRKSVPLYLVGLGNDQPPKDVRLSDLLVDDVVFLNDIVNFDVKLHGSGYEGQSVTLKLRVKGNDRPLAEQTVAIGKDGETQSIRLSHRPDTAGEFEFVIDFEPLAGEAIADNNRQSRLVAVRDEKIRVLLAQEYPSFEFRFLSTLLGRQLRGEESEAGKSIELTTVLQQADEKFVQADDRVRKVFPVGRDELFEYDVIILGDVNPDGFGKLVMEHIADFVKVRGGGLVFIAGQHHMPVAFRDTPLAELMPIDVSSAAAPDPKLAQNRGFQIQPTPLGLTSPQFQLGDSVADNLRVWREFEPLYWLLEAPDLKPGARVLAEHPTLTGAGGRNLPVIAMHYVGAGKVVFHATDETHRWRIRKGDKYFARYWIQTIRYLSRSRLLGQSRTAELTSDREVYRHGDPISLRVKFLDDRLAPPQDDGVTVVLEHNGGRRRHISLRRQSATRGIFEGTISGLAEGTYNIWIATPTMEGSPPAVKLSVVAPPGEQAQLEMDSADLRRAAKTSLGRFYTIETAHQLLDDLPEGRQVHIASMPPVSIWGQWYVALIFAIVFVVLIVTEWLLRKLLGML